VIAASVKNGLELPQHLDVLPTTLDRLESTLQPARR
jgi:hypothetical protein